jgi:hypothetical protein
MNAVGKKPNSAPTVSDLEFLQAQIERDLVAAQRKRSAALNARAAVICEGIPAQVAASRLAVSEAGAEIHSLEEELKSTTEAVALAKKSERGSLNNTRYAAIRRAVGRLVQSASACEDSGSAKALVKVREDRQSVADELSRSGVPTDTVQHLFTDAQILRIYDLQVWLDSDQTAGRGPGLDTPLQLRESGRASLRIQSNEFRSVVLRSARLSLGVSEINEEKT